MTDIIELEKMTDTIELEKMTDTIELEKMTDTIELEKKLIAIKFDIHKHGKQCIEEECYAFNLILRDDKNESNIRKYRKHIAEMSHPQWEPFLSKQLGPHHEQLCELGYHCPFLYCKKDADKTHIQIFKHLWQYRHKRIRHRGKRVPKNT
jgi:hypothetical protein